MKRTPPAHRRKLNAASERLSVDQAEARRRDMRRSTFDRASHLMWGRRYSEELAARVARWAQIFRLGIVDPRPKKSLADELSDVLLSPEAAHYAETVMRELLAQHEETSIAPMDQP